jgi:hypothetical protein
MAIEWWYVLSGLVILVGLLGTVLPALPGVPLVFAGMALAAWAGDFQHISGVTLVLLGILTGVAVLIDFIASALGTKVAGASKWAFVGAGVGALVGIFFGLIGLLIGPFLGAVAGELLATNDMQRATKAGAGATVGLFLGAVAKIALCFTMLGIFAFALLL